jgi:hypothetical protein
VQALLPFYIFCRKAETQSIGIKEGPWTDYRRE